MAALVAALVIVVANNWALPRPEQNGQGSGATSRKPFPWSTRCTNKKAPQVLRGTGQRMLSGALAKPAVKPAPLKICEA